MVQVIFFLLLAYFSEYETFRRVIIVDRYVCLLVKQYFKDINLEKHCKTMSKWMVIVKLWENGDKLGKIEYLWSNDYEEMIDDINLDIGCL